MSTNKVSAGWTVGGARKSYRVLLLALPSGTLPFLPSAACQKLRRSECLHLQSIYHIFVERNRKLECGAVVIVADLAPLEGAESESVGQCGVCGGRPGRSVATSP